MEKQFKTKSSSGPPVPEPARADLDSTTLRALKKKFKEFGIFLFPCNKCSDGLQALHLSKCLKPGCGSVNHFHQPGCLTDEAKWRQCNREIILAKKWFQVPTAKPDSKPSLSDLLAPQQAQ